MKKHLLLLSLLVWAPTVWASKGDRYASERVVFRAPESGLEVEQLTTDAADDAVLYFTGESIQADGGGLVFASKRGGRWNLYLMNLQDYTFIQLTDGRSISATGAVLAPSTGDVFYKDGRFIKAVNLRTLGERDVVALPDGYAPGSAMSVSRDGKTLAFSLTENITVQTKTDKLYSDMDERFEKRPWSSVFIGQTDGSGWHEIARQKKWISHVIIGPLGNVVLYCHEGRWNLVEQRLWLIDPDDRHNRALRPEETPELQIGHEYWYPDGLRVGYHGSYPNKGGSFVGVANSQTGAFSEYRTASGNAHTQANAQGTLFVGDGSEKEPFLKLYRLQNEALQERILWRHGGSFARQEWHPHPRFAPDGRSVLFTSSRDGNGNIYRIWVETP